MTAATSASVVGETVRVQARPVDPRDTRWQVGSPLYRVYFWADANHCDEWEVEAADVGEAMSWAEGRAEGRNFVLYAVVRSSEGLGLVRLAGARPP
jgi:hypothetical protein